MSVPLVLTPTASPLLSGYSTTAPAGPVPSRPCDPRPVTGRSPCRGFANGGRRVSPVSDVIPLAPAMCCIVRWSWCRELETARQNHRWRLCGAPVSSALNTSHSQSNPRTTSELSTRSRKAPPSAVRMPGTFSRKTYRGSTSPMIRAMSSQMNRLSSIPPRLPAMLTGWHGNPAATRSTAPRHGRPSKVVTSSQTGA
jgi:hypothetical protein